MLFELIIPAAAALFVLVVAARPLWDIRHQLWSTLDWRDLTRLGLAVLALLLPVGLLMSALPHVSWLENILPKSLLPDERPPVSSHAAFVRSLSDRGEIYRSQGRYLEAEALFKQALAVIERNGGLTHPDFSILLSGLAQLYCDQGRYVEAETLYERALTVRERALGRYDPSLSVILISLADLYRAQNLYGKAEPLYRRALTINEFALRSGHPDPDSTLDDFAQLLRGQGRFGEAEPLLNRSMVSQGWLDVAVCLNKLADLYGAQGRYADADPLYKRSFIVLGNILDRLLSSERSGAAAAAQMFQTAQRALAAEAGLHRGPRELTHEWRKRDGTGLPNTGRIAAVDKGVGIEQDQKSELAQFAAIENPEPLSLGQVQAGLRSDEALVLYVTRPKADATLAWVVTKTDVRWQRIDLGTEALNERAKALRCGLDSTLWRDAQSADKCRELLQLSPDVGGVEDQIPDILPFNLARAHELYRALLAPFRDIVKNKSLLIVASRSLSSLPFNVLVTEPPKTAILSTLDQYRDVPWLGTQHPITLLPSPSVIRVRQRAKASVASRPYLGIGNPLLDGQQDHPEWGAYYEKQARASRDKQQCPKAEVGHGTVASGRPVVSSSGGYFKVDKIHTWDPLPETADILCEVGRRLAASESDVLLGYQASKSMLRALSEADRLAEYRILYFATHCALTSQKHGLVEPGLVLTPQQAGATDPGKLVGDNGLLTVDEIKALKLDADWIALSPCNTIGGREENLDTLFGLAVAFFPRRGSGIADPLLGGPFRSHR